MNNTDNLVDFAQSSFKDLGVLIFLGLREEKRKLSSNQTFARQQQSRPQFVLTALFEDTKSCLKEIETSLPSKYKSKYGKTQSMR